ncbi:ZP domain-containing protein [Trichostrongylus colubriformis]|uniref:ZP domain-containing protein n=1 Tax=Trichostrongylus colubriformis TaxID=6319 RepID=A0AAN8IGF8_TRICO
MLIALLALMSSTLCADEEYAALMRSDVTARVLPLRITINSTEPLNATCALTLHRIAQLGPNLTSIQIAVTKFSEKLCITKHRAYHAMRVESCWVGTRKSPVYLVKPDGCTAESALLHTPSYASFSRAVSVGWLSIRQAGVSQLLVSCHIRLCHFCDESCRETTPPRLCRDAAGKHYDRMWNESTVVERLCNPPIETTTIGAALINEALSSPVWDLTIVIVFSYLLFNGFCL